MPLTPDTSMLRRVNELERRVDELSRMLLKSTRPDKEVVPLNARLWRATLNADMSSGTATADLVTLGGVDTGLDITVTDAIDGAASLENTDATYVLEQLDLDGSRKFIVIGGGDGLKRTFCRFTLDSAMANTDASNDATITAQYGPGDTHATTDITVYNIAASSDYIFEGDSGDAGIAFWDHANSKWWIVQMECP